MSVNDHSHKALSASLAYNRCSMLIFVMYFIGLVPGPESGTGEIGD